MNIFFIWHSHQEDFKLKHLVMNKEKKTDFYQL